MNDFINEITLDINCVEKGLIISAGQFDIGRKIKAHIQSDGKEYNVSGSSAVFKGKKSDGKYFATDDCVITDNCVVITLTEQMLAARGWLTAKIVLSDATKTYSTNSFIIDVDNALEGDITSIDDYAILNHLLQKIKILDNGTSVPDYWLSHLNSRADEIRQAMETAGCNNSSFLFYTDAHWDYGSQMSPTLLRYLYMHTAINKIIFGGDIVNTEPTAATLSDREIMSYLWEWRQQIKDLQHYSVVGNHDDGNATNNIFNANYVYSYLFAPEARRHCQGRRYILLL